jgi:DNA polymerase II small subunit
MLKKDLLDYCLKKNILLDNYLIEILKIYDFELIQLFLEKLNNYTGKKFLNKFLIENNQEIIKKFIDEISLSKNNNFLNLKEKLGIKEDCEKKIVEKSQIVNNEGKVKLSCSNPTIPKSLAVKDFIIHFKRRYNDLKNILQDRPEFENLVSIGKVSGEKQKISVIGMVYNKKMTKNGNLILEIEDITGRMKVLISSNKEELLKETEDITLDSVLGFKGLGNKDILFVNEIIFPETILSERKKATLEEYALFIGDIHFGSQNFMEKDFLRFINYLNGDLSNNSEISKIKYLFIVGDLITGVGNYPNQEKDLLIVDLEEQFQKIANLLGKIRKDIKIIISPGNHDGVRLMEPQPLLDEKYAWPLYELENVIVTENPAVVNIGERDGFSGFNVLTYHGFSFPYYANNISKLMLGKSMNDPIKIMEYLLKNRHLAPTHASTQYFPNEKDSLLIRNAPDIFVAGHTHKSGVVHYNNVLVISISSWEGMTPYQEKFGNKPDHCKVPMFNLKTRQVKILDFENLNEEDGIKRYKEKNDKQ